MTMNAKPEIVGEPKWDREAVRRSLSLVVVLLALILLPILAHGCHGGGDLDLEPGAPPGETKR
jgi:hypothetical protein